MCVRPFEQFSHVKLGFRLRLTSIFGVQRGLTAFYVHQICRCFRFGMYGLASHNHWETNVQRLTSTLDRLKANIDE